MDKVKFCPHVYSDWLLLFQTLTPEQSAEVLKGIAGYPDYEVKDVPIWNFIKSQIDKEYTDFVERCDKAKKAIEKRWNTDEQPSIKKDTKTNDSIQTNTNVYDRIPITRTETRTETIKEKTPKGVKEKADAFLDTLDQNWKDVFVLWIDYRKQIKKPLKEVSFKSCFDSLIKLSGNNVLTAKEIISQSIANGWQGLFELKTNTGTAVRPANSNTAKTKGDILQQRYLETLGFMEA